MDLDSGFLCVHTLYSSSLIPPKAFVAWLEFESEGFDHLVCSCLLHYLHRFALSMVIRGIEVEKLLTLGCIVFPRACASWVHCVP